jgi:hypothetical protein
MLGGCILFNTGLIGLPPTLTYIMDAMDVMYHSHGCFLWTFHNFFLLLQRTGVSLHCIEESVTFFLLFDRCLTLQDFTSAHMKLRTESNSVIRKKTIHGQTGKKWLCIDKRQSQGVEINYTKNAYQSEWVKLYNWRGYNYVKYFLLLYKIWIISAYNISTLGLYITNCVPVFTNFTFEASIQLAK